MREFLLDFKEKLVRHSFAASLRERLPGEQSTSDPPGQRVDSSFVFLSAVSAVGVGFVADRFQTRHALLVSMLLVAGGAVAMLFIGPETDRRVLARHAVPAPPVQAGRR